MHTGEGAIGLGRGVWDRRAGMGRGTSIHHVVLVWDGMQSNLRRQLVAGVCPGAGSGGARTLQHVGGREAKGDMKAQRLLS
jgi:hypothetical protein